jgi:Zn-finger nucleic acid-binding protein
METDLTSIIQLELKYCERCGGLWLRQSRSDSAYCRSCVLILADFPTVRAKREGKKRRRSRQPRPDYCCGRPQGAAV